MVQVSSGAWVLISGALLGGVILALPRIKAEVEDSPLGSKDKDAVVSDLWKGIMIEGILWKVIQSIQNLKKKRR